MKKKQKTSSKIPTTKTNTNRKKNSESAEGEKPMTFTLLKKNEFALILFGALLLTLIVFFVFFQSPDKSNLDKPNSVKPKTEKSLTDSDRVLSDRNQTGGDAKSPSFDDLVKRIEMLEKLILKTGNDTTQDPSGLTSLKERVNRLETAYDLKFSTLAEKMGGIEKKIAALNSKQSLSAVKTDSPSVKSVPQKTQTASKSAVKKVVASSPKAPMFHTVQKGETLYSISKKYKISVAALQKLNKLTADSTIYPGMNILIR